MIKLVDITPGTKAYTQLGHRVLAVLSRRADGWCVYVDAVPGVNHDLEWQAVAQEGTKLDEATATAIIQNRFFPGFDPAGLPYVR